MAENEMIIYGFDMKQPDYRRVVILKEKATNRYLPIWMGMFEADAIITKFFSAKELAEKDYLPIWMVPWDPNNIPRKPLGTSELTHDFACSIIKTLGAYLISVVINELKNDVFYAKTRLKSNGQLIEIDCRPSDAIAVAIRENAPIFVDEEILKMASVTRPQ